MTTINLLPWREEAKQQRQKQFNIMAGTAFLAAVLLVVIASTVIGNATDLQQRRNNYVKNEIAIVDQKISEIKQLRQKKEDLKKRMDLIERLQNTRNLSTHLLDSVASVISPGVYLNNIKRENNSMSFRGLAESNNHLANMLRNIENSKWLKNPLVKQINSEDDQVRQLNSFSLRVDINAVLEQEAQ